MAALDTPAVPLELLAELPKIGPPLAREYGPSSEALAAAQRELAVEERRRPVILEIWDTERKFLQSLTLVQTLYQAPLLAGQPPIIPPETVAIIMSNIDEIASLARELLRLLTQRLQSPAWAEHGRRVGDIFLKIAPFFKLYAAYVGNYDKASHLVTELLKTNDSFEAFAVEAAAKPESGGQNLLALLLTPIQRVPRYRLLLADLVKCTPSDHPDHDDVVQAYDTTTEVATFINQSLKEEAHVARIVALQKCVVGLNEPLIKPGRRFLHEGVLLKSCRRTLKPRAFFLFSDLLFYASLNPATPGAPQTYTVHRKLPLEVVRAEPQPDSAVSQHALAVLSLNKSFVVQASTAKERDLWVARINDAADDYRKRRSTFGNADDAKAYLRSSITADSHYGIPGFMAPVWVPNDAAPACMVCRAEFTMLRRRHHCRLCGIVVCGECGPKRFMPMYGEMRQFRICNNCAARQSPDLRSRRSISTTSLGSDPGRDRLNSDGPQRTGSTSPSSSGLERTRSRQRAGSRLSAVNNGENASSGTDDEWDSDEDDSRSSVAGSEASAPRREGASGRPDSRGAPSPQFLEVHHGVHRRESVSKVPRSGSPQITTSGRAVERLSLAEMEHKMRAASLSEGGAASLDTTTASMSAAHSTPSLLSVGIRSPESEPETPSASALDTPFSAEDSSTPWTIAYSGTLTVEADIAGKPSEAAPKPMWAALAVRTGLSVAVSAVKLFFYREQPAMPLDPSRGLKSAGLSGAIDLTDLISAELEPDRQRANARFAVRLITLDGMYYLATESADEQHGWLEAISGVIHGLTARPTATVRTPAVPTAAVITAAQAPRKVAAAMSPAPEVASPTPSRSSPAPSTPEPPKNTTSQPFTFQATRPPPALPTDATAPKDLLTGPALKQGYLARQEPASKDWKVVYCVVDPTAAVLYAGDATTRESKPVGKITFSQCRTVAPVPVSSLLPFGFAILTPQATLFFNAANATERVAWIDILQSRIRATQRRPTASSVDATAARSRGGAAF